MNRYTHRDDVLDLLVDQGAEHDAHCAWPGERTTGHHAAPSARSVGFALAAWASVVGFGLLVGLVLFAAVTR